MTQDQQQPPDDSISHEEGLQQQKAKKSVIKEDENNGDVSSVASSMYSQMRSYFNLRNSIDEKFVPLGIRNLKNAAMLVFFGLLALIITQFTIQNNLFQQVNMNIQNIH